MKNKCCFKCARREVCDNACTEITCCDCCLIQDCSEYFAISKIILEIKEFEKLFKQ